MNTFLISVAAAFRLRLAWMATGLSVAPNPRLASVVANPERWWHTAKRSLKAVATIALVVLLSGCDQIAPTDGLPYVNHIVIKGLLVAGQPLDSISVSHTLPLSSWYDPSSAAVPDARVVVSVDGKSIPLTYTGFGYFSDMASDTVASGKTYHISVDWNGLHAEASTLVPHAPVVDSFTLTDFHNDTITFSNDPLDTFFEFGGLLETSIRPNSSEVYGVADDSVSAIGDSNYYYKSYDNFNYYYPGAILRATDAGSDGRIWIRRFADTGLNDSLFAITETIDAFDAPYFDIVSTFRNYNNTDIFGTGGANPKWNVTGDGIGMFIGMASTRVSKTVRR